MGIFIHVSTVSCSFNSLFLLFLAQHKVMMVGYPFDHLDFTASTNPLHAGKRRIDTESQHGVKILLMARVTLGDVHYVQHADQHKKLRRAPLVAGKKGLVHDSVVANEGQARTTYGKQYHREYIVYDRSQAYPEYVVFFEPG